MPCTRFKLALVPALLVVALFVGGCSTFDKRASERASVFQSLDATTQARLEAKRIELGDSEDMVYIALGRPHAKRETISAEGREVSWIYNSYWQEYRGQQFMGYRSHTVRDSAGNARVYFEPVERPVYEQRQEERTRVVFRDGRVVLVEQVQ